MVMGAMEGCEQRREQVGFLWPLCGIRRRHKGGQGFNKAVQMQRLHGFWKCLKVE